MGRCAFLLVIAFSLDEAVGPVEYARDGVRFNGKLVAWKKLSKLTEADPEGAAFDTSDAEWKSLVGKLVVDNRDRDAIAGIKARVGRRPAVDLAPPLEGRWLAMEDKTRHHQIKSFAIHAIDFVNVDAAGNLFLGGGRGLEDHYGFGAPVYAALDGEVGYSVDRFNDLPSGQIGKFDEANFISIRHEGGVSTDYGHLKKGSAVVKPGQKVRKGDLIARVGNSGASGMPHLHFTASIAVYNDAGQGAVVGVPYRFEGFRLVKAFKTDCDVEGIRARPQEGWTMVFPKRS